MQDFSVKTCDYSNGGGLVYSTFQKVGGGEIYLYGQLEICPVV